MPYKEMNSQCPNVRHVRDLALLYFEDDSHRGDYRNSVRYQRDTVMSTNRMGRYKMTYKSRFWNQSNKRPRVHTVFQLIPNHHRSNIISRTPRLPSRCFTRLIWKLDTSHYYSLQSFSVHSAQSNCVISAESGNIF